MQVAKLNGIKTFIRNHFEKVIFLNCIVAAVVLYLHDIMYSLDGGGHYVSAKDLLEVGLHGYNDHYFFGGIQNLFYPPLHDILLGALIKINELLLANMFSDRILYSLFVWLTFSFYIYALYKVSKSFQAIFAKIFVVLFSSWTLYLNIYSYEKYWTSSLNFYNTPHITFFQGLTFHDIYITGLTTQFLSAGFLILSILSLTQRNLVKSSVLISCSMLSHFIFGLVAVLFCTVKKLFKFEIKDLLVIGGICFGLTAFFLVPMIAYHDYMFSQVSMPLRTGFWLSIVGFSFLLFKRNSFSFYLSFTSLLLVVFIGAAKLLQKHDFPIFNFHYYRFLFPSLLILILATGFAINENSSKARKLLICGTFLVAWFGNFGGRFYTERLFEVYEPRIASITPAIQNDFSAGRTYFFGLSRPIDFALELNTHLGGQRSFFTKGLYWESAPSNNFISESLYQLMGPPTVLGYKHDNLFENKSCEVVSCFFRAVLNRTVATEIWMPSKDTLNTYFNIGFKERDKFVSCYDTVINSLEESAGIIDLGAARESRYINTSTSMIKSYDSNAISSVRDIVSRCEKNPSDDGRINSALSPKLKRISAGHYLAQLAQTDAKYEISLQYFPGITYSTAGTNNLVPESKPTGMVLQGSGPTEISYQRTWIIWMGYLISIMTTLGLVTLLVQAKYRTHSDK